MPHNFQRPNLPYNAESLPNDNRYQLLTRSNNRPPTDSMLDTDFNYVIDGLRQLDQDIINVEAGALQGSDDPNNANSLVTTDGAGNIGWVKIQDSNIADRSISNIKLIPQTITGNEIQDGTITTTKIAPNAVTTDKIASLGVTTDKIATLAVTTNKIAGGAVTTNEIAANAVTSSKIIDGAVTTTKIANNAVTTNKIAAGAVTANEIANQTIEATQIANQTITATQIANNTITFNQISNSFAATQSQQESASSSSVFVSPARQQYHPSAAQAWVLFDGTSGNILKSYNVSGVSKQGTGIFRITFSSPFVDNDYLCFGTVQQNNMRVCVIDDAFTPTTTQIQVKIYVGSTDATDSKYVNCVFFGELA